MDRPALPACSQYRDGRRELVVFALAYLIYVTGRWLTVGDRAAAFAHARSVIELERSLGLTVEPGIQSALGARVVEVVMSYV